MGVVLLMDVSLSILAFVLCLIRVGTEELEIWVTLLKQKHKIHEVFQFMLRYHR